jgi:two-component system LytT family response regulator
MIKTIIIDDEERSRKLLRNLLEKRFSEVSIIAEASSVKTGLEAIKSSKPDLIFLDIQMPDGTGFDLLNNIEDINFEIIVTTAYEEFALDAYNEMAIGYILKPISEKLFLKVMDKALGLISFTKNISSTDNDKLHIGKSFIKDKLRKMIIGETEGYTVVSLDKIIRIEADRNYSRFYFTESEPIVSSYNLGTYAKILRENKEFFRISKSHIINLNFVDKYLKSDGGYVIMKDGVSLHIIDGRKEEFKNFFF